MVKILIVAGSVHETFDRVIPLPVSNKVFFFRKSKGFLSGVAPTSYSIVRSLDFENLAYCSLQAIKGRYEVIRVEV